MAIDLAFLFLISMISCNGQQPPPAPSNDNDYPKQEKCPAIQAKKLYKAGTSEGAWALVKVTPLPNPPPKQFHPSINFCSPFTYLPGACQGVMVRIREFPDDKSITLHTFSSNNVTESLVHFANNAQLQDHWYAVYQGKPVLMDEFFDDGRHKLVNPIPQVVLDSQSEEFVKVAKNHRWMVFQNCVTKFAWVLLKDDAVIKDLWRYQNEYMAAMRAMNIDVDNMVDVPIKDNRWDEIL